MGSFVLVASLAIGEGVQHALLGTLRKQDQLRRITVWPSGRPKSRKQMADLPVPGSMSAARRDRLREAHRLRLGEPAGKPPPPGLSAEMVAAIAAIEHVEAVTPSFTWNGQIDIGGLPSSVVARSADETDPSVNRRLVAGRLLEPGEKAILVSEFVLYWQWGIQDEADISSVLNKPARLHLNVNTPNVGLMLFLLNVSRPNLTAAEEAVLKKLMGKLPQALASLDLTDAEKKLMAGILRESRPESSRAAVVSLPVVGVIRDHDRTELGPWDSGPSLTDIVVSPAAGRDLYFSVPGRAQNGLPSVSVRVDQEEHLRGVEEKIKDLGLSTFSLADLLDQIRLNSLLISAACTLVALISLAVASLGITNTMLMSVLERTFEIGVMKATGARDGHVMGLFLMEGALIGVMGALSGLVFAWLASFPGDAFAHHLVASRTPMKLDGSIFLFRPWIVVGVPAAVCLLNTLAAIYPARRAARVDPIEALRQRG